MKLLHLTDLHFHLSWFDWVIANQDRFDVIAMTGDFSDHPTVARGTPFDAQWRQIAEKMVQITKPVFACGGNQDVNIPLKSPAFGIRPAHLHDLAAAMPNLRVNGRVELFNERLFVCCPFRSLDPINRQVLSSQAPVIVLTHVGPNKSPVTDWQGRDSGDANLRAMAEKLPEGSMILSGHVHLRRHWADKVGETLCLNPGSPPTVVQPNHVVIDTDGGTATLFNSSGAESIDLPGLVTTG